MQDAMNAGKDHVTLQKYLSLEQNGKVQCEYIWIGGIVSFPARLSHPNISESDCAQALDLTFAPRPERCLRR